MIAAVRGHLPNLLIVGAAKSGTTSLHRYLAHHPQVFMSEKKELQLFSGRDWQERLAWYRAQFPVDAPVRGESSPGYSMDPILPHVPERIHSVMPDARIVYLVRDPVERLVPHWVEFYALGLEKKGLTDALADYDSPSNVYAMTSRYMHQLDRYREWFSDSRILVLDQRDLLADRLATLRQVFEFIGVDPEFWSPEFDTMHNVREEKVRYNGFGRALYRYGIFPRLPPGVQRRARRLIGDAIPPPVIDEVLLDGLAAYLREDADRLRAYTGRSFDHWSV